MPNETGEDEPMAFENERTHQNYVLPATVWFVEFATIAYITFLMFRIWEDEELRLQFLHTMTTIFQALARAFGTWALQCEIAYNDYANSLH